MSSSYIYEIRLRANINVGVKETNDADVGVGLRQDADRCLQKNVMQYDSGVQRSSDARGDCLIESPLATTKF